MRADMKDVLVNTIRHKYGEKRKCSVEGMSLEKMEELPERAGIRRNHTDWGFEFGDRLSPLYKFLKKNADRPWADVWSEICEVCDSRNVRGKHLRDHVQSYVTGAGGQESLGRWWRRNEFYVDDDGILRYNNDRRRYRYTPKLDPDKCKIGDRLFERINNCWFEVWYEKEEKARKAWNYYLNRQEVEYYYTDVKVRQRQLSRRELRDLRLSNTPDFKWWEANVSCRG